jgi:16S rRNA (cytosine967-C5)-methyltransferase
MPKRYLRVNSLKCTREELQAALAKSRSPPFQWKGGRPSLQVTSDAALFRTQAFADGCFEQQDAGSQLVPPRSTSSPACGSSTPVPVPAARPCTWPP